MTKRSLETAILDVTELRGQVDDVIKGHDVQDVLTALSQIVSRLLVEGPDPKFMLHVFTELLKENVEEVAVARTKIH